MLPWACSGLSWVTAASHGPVPIARPGWASALSAPAGGRAQAVPAGHTALEAQGGAAGRAASWDAKVHEQKAKGTPALRKKDTPQVSALLGVNIRVLVTSHYSLPLHSS